MNAAPALAGLFALIATAAMAQDLRLQCSGVDPDWDLSIDGPRAEFSYVTAPEMDIPQSSSAEGRDWPKALTLLGGRDTAIVILDAHQCSDAQVTGYPITASILTQRGETPVILAGCCRELD